MSSGFCIQIQRVRFKDSIKKIEALFDVIYAHSGCNSIDLTIDFCRAENYCNIFVESSDAVDVWKSFLMFVEENSFEFEWLTKRWIVVFEGDHGWSDYLLLRHFDSSAGLDTVSRES